MPGFFGFRPGGFLGVGGRWRLTLTDRPDVMWFYFGAQPMGPRHSPCLRKHYYEQLRSVNFVATGGAANNNRRVSLRFSFLRNSRSICSASFTFLKRELPGFNEVRHPPAACGRRTDPTGRRSAGFARHCARLRFEDMRIPIFLTAEAPLALQAVNRGLDGGIRRRPRARGRLLDLADGEVPWSQSAA